MSRTSNGQRSDGSARTYIAAPYCNSGRWTPMNTNEYYERTPAASFRRLPSVNEGTQSGTPAPSSESPSDAESSYSALMYKTRMSRGGRVAVDLEIQRVATHMEEARQICWTAQKLASDASPELLAEVLATLGCEAGELTDRGNSWVDAGNKFLTLAPKFQRLQQSYHDSVLHMRTREELLAARSQTDGYNSARALFLGNFDQVQQLGKEYAEECDHQIQVALENMKTPTARSTPQGNEQTKERIEELRQRLQRTLASVAEGGYVYNTPIRRESEVTPSQQSGCRAVSFGYSTTTISQSSQARSVLIA